MKPRKEHYRCKLPHFQQPGQWYSVTCSLFGAMPESAMQKYSIQLEVAKNRLENLKVGLSKTDIQQLSDFPKSESLALAKKDYQIALRKYRLAFDKILNNSNLPKINLAKEINRKIIEEALLFWEGKRLTSHAWCIMSNHFHWVLSVFEKEVGVSGVGLSKSDNSDLGKSKSPGVGFSKSDKSDLENQSPGVGLGKSNTGNPVYLQDILHSVKLFSAHRINKNEKRKGQLWNHESFETTIRNDRHFVNVVNYTLNNPVNAGLVKNWQDWPGSRTF